MTVDAQLLQAALDKVLPQWEPDEQDNAECVVRQTLEAVLPSIERDRDSLLTALDDKNARIVTLTRAAVEVLTRTMGFVNLAPRPYYTVPQDAYEQLREVLKTDD